MNKRRDEALLVTYRRNWKAAKWGALGISLAWPMLALVNFFRPIGLTWREILLVPLPCFILPVSVIVVNESGYRFLRWLHRDEDQPSDREA